MFGTKLMPHVTVNQWLLHGEQRDGQASEEGSPVRCPLWECVHLLQERNQLGYYCARRQSKLT